MDTIAAADYKRTTMAVLAYEGVRPFQLSVPCEIFGEVHCEGVDPELWVCALKPGLLRTSSGFSVGTTHSLADVPRADVVFIPSWRLPYQPPPPELIDALIEAHTNGATIVGLCLGAFILAETGLLDGKRATTHWAFSQEFRQRFPAVELDEMLLYVDEGELLTSAGVAAGIDCCLHIARRLYGAHQANRIARNVLAPPYRAGGQAQFIERPLGKNLRDARFRSALDEIVRNLGRKHSIDTLASSLAMSRRSFTRHFHQIMGVSFGEWLINERLLKARRDLEATNESVDQIALDAGFGNTKTFREQFLVRLGVSPAQWRRSFRGA
ncbi:GlxA family transcriptional regulator [Shinella sp.]|uniref:GlxA family transcriptional regulator n=1 Tax=Shinella sp. TaxID=1870904 RepID=UPI0029A5FB4A|nr:helix-turn-helix domain-containing protein [Shinella sp.]MDX3978212.1 helix-turn-helix domain-containing protein [Shinella sp.]